MLLTKILDPSKMNAETMAEIAWGNAKTEDERMVQIDLMERVLDGLVNRGIVE